MKVIFKDKIKSYAIIAFLGILMGASVGLTANLPSDDLWGFAYWATSAYGFWMFSCSLLVLLSEKRKTAVINTVLYVLSVYIVTYAFKLMNFYYNNSNSEGSLAENIFSGATGYLSYSWMAVIGSGILAVFLYSGRVNSICGKILRVLPAIVMALEGCLFGYHLFTSHQMLFYFIVDIVCTVLYLLIIRKSLNSNNNEKLEKKQLIWARTSIGVLTAMGVAVAVFAISETFINSKQLVSISIASNNQIEITDTVSVDIYDDNGKLVTTALLEDDYPSFIPLKSGKYTLKAKFADDEYELEQSEINVDKENTEYVLSVREAQ